MQKDQYTGGGLNAFKKGVEYAKGTKGAFSPLKGTEFDPHASDTQKQMMLKQAIGGYGDPVASHVSTGLGDEAGLDGSTIYDPKAISADEHNMLYNAEQKHPDSLLQGWFSDMKGESPLTQVSPDAVDHTGIDASFLQPDKYDEYADALDKAGILGKLGGGGGMGGMMGGL